MLHVQSAAPCIKQTSALSEERMDGMFPRNVIMFDFQTILRETGGNRVVLS